MAQQTINTENAGGNWWNPLQWGGGYNSQFSQDGSANIGGALVGLTKKEVSVSEQNSTQFTDARDMSTSSVTTTTDARSFTLTNAPTLVFGQAGGNVGAQTSQSVAPNVSPMLYIDKPQSIGQTTDQTSDQSRGLDLEKIALYLAIAGVVYLLISGGIGSSKKAVENSPQAKAVKKVRGKAKK